MSDAENVPAPQPRTLFEWAGGEPAIARLINTFYDRVERDEMLSAYFPGGVHADHRLHVT
jgi:hemoglobin